MISFTTHSPNELCRVIKKMTSKVCENEEILPDQSHYLAVGIFNVHYDGRLKMKGTKTSVHDTSIYCPTQNEYIVGKKEC